MGQSQTSAQIPIQGGSKRCMGCQSAMAHTHTRVRARARTHTHTCKHAYIHREGEKGKERESEGGRAREGERGRGERREHLPKLQLHPQSMPHGDQVCGIPEAEHEQLCAEHGAVMLPMTRDLDSLKTVAHVSLRMV